MPELRPSQTVRVLQTIHTREGDWRTDVEGKILALESRPTGSFGSPMARTTSSGSYGCKDAGKTARYMLLLRHRHLLHQMTPKNRHLVVTRELPASVLHGHFLPRDKLIPDMGMSNSD